MITLTPTPLTQDAFAPYGDVISKGENKSSNINSGTCKRFDRLAVIDTHYKGGEPIISIFEATAYPQPFTIKMLERHPLGSQAFYPLGGQKWLIVTAKCDKSTQTPEAKDCRAFIATAEQGIQFHRGTWHHPLIVLTSGQTNGQDFLVIDRSGPGENCDIHHFQHEYATINLNQ